MLVYDVSSACVYTSCTHLTSSWLQTAEKQGTMVFVYAYLVMLMLRLGVYLLDVGAQYGPPPATLVALHALVAVGLLHYLPMYLHALSICSINSHHHEPH